MSTLAQDLFELKRLAVGGAGSLTTYLLWAVVMELLNTQAAYHAHNPV